MIGETISHYRVLEKLGEGGMGEVYKALDPRLDRMVAIKLLPDRLRDDAEARAQLHAEARAASALDHPNICTIHELGQTPDDSLFIAMAYYEGETLDRRLAAGAIPLDEALRIALGVARGVEAAHGAGVIHRDIKPSNIFLTDRGDVKLLDFGIARRGLAGRSEADSVTGTPAYMSPELAVGREADERSDLWSIGVLLYEMFSGRQPFGGDYSAAILYGIVNEDPDPLPDAVPPPLREVVSRLLEKDPGTRLGSASKLIAALESVQRTQPAAPPRLANFPDFLNSFVGREEDIAVIEGLLDRCRLVTLTGTGGSGKTRLSLEVAAHVAPKFEHGVCFVELAPISDPALVLSAIASALDVEEEAGSTIAADIRLFLQSLRILLVLDNFEHALDAAPEVHSLLESCPGTKVLTSSRAALGVAGEQEYQVPPLALPPDHAPRFLQAADQSAAVQLFVDRAQAADPRFELNESNVEDVTRICRELDGLPLAIELAAARTKLFPPRALASRLGRSLDLLKGSGRGRPARHRTLRQAIEWSYDLLDESSRRFLRRLSCFAGGWTVEAAEALCRDNCNVGSDALDLLSALAEQSLIRQNEGFEGEPRFELLETIKAFALERLQAEGEEPRVRDLHKDYFLSLAEQAAPQLTGGEQGRWLDLLETENDNFRAALDWAERSGDLTSGLALGAALWRFWISRLHVREGMARLGRLLEASGVDAESQEVRLRAVNGFATLCHYAGETRRSCDVLAKSVEVCRSLDDRKSLATLLNNLVWTHIELSELEKARLLAEEALEINQEVGDERGIAVALNNLGWVANYQHRYRDAVGFHTRGLAIRREIQDRRGIAFVLGSLAWAEQYHGDLDRALALVDEATAILEELRDEPLIAWIRNNRARILRDRGDTDAVVTMLREALDSERHSHQFLVAWKRTTLGAVLWECGDEAGGREQLDISRKFWERVGFLHGLAANLYETGRLELQNDFSQGTLLLERSLSLWRQLGVWAGVAECLEALAMRPATGPEQARQVTALAAADRIRQELEAPAPPRLRVPETIERLRSQVSATQFEEAWAAGRALTRPQATECLRA